MSNSAITGPTLIDFPAGMVMPYAGSTTPAGWLECNGAEVDISAYPALAAALGSTWNTAKNPLTGANYAAPAAGKFRVPDMRGAFLRGSSGGVNNAQGVATGLAEFQSHKTAKNSLSGTAAAQTLAATATSTAMSGNTSHAHTFPWGTTAGSTGRIGSTFQSNDISFNSSTSNNSSSVDHTHNITSLSLNSSLLTLSGDAETRPDAVGVRYLIKF